MIRHQGHTVYLGAIQIVPLSSHEVDAVLKDRKDTLKKRLIVKHDQPMDLEITIEQLQNRDFPLPQNFVSRCLKEELPLVILQEPVDKK